MQIKPETKLVVGLMSGTSVDGIDAALVRVRPDFTVEFIEGVVYKYPEEIKNKIFDIFRGKTSVEEICWMNFVLGECFAKAAIEVIKKAGLAPDKVDLIGSHGQTIFHKPQEDCFAGFSKKSTLQIGEASVISERTGITTISDFRVADIAAGGQGAPLVSFADEKLFKKDKIRAIQNIGGMGNVTIVGPDIEPFAFDTGPGNVIIDYCANKFFNQSYDKDGKFAIQGRVNEKWLNEFLKEEYYSRKPPKTTGRELFAAEYIEEKLLSAPESPHDIIATVTELTARTIYDAYKNFVFPKVKFEEVVIGGGGGFNPVLIDSLKKHLGQDIAVLKHADFGISDEYKEAISFAMLAYATYYKISSNVPSCTGAKHEKILGKVCYY